MRGVKVAAVTNDFFEDMRRHYITIFVRCEVDGPDADPVVSDESAPKNQRASVGHGESGSAMLTESKRTWSPKSARAGTG